MDHQSWPSGSDRPLRRAVAVSVDGDSLSRTAKILMDSGAAASERDATAQLHGFVLQVLVGRGLGANRSRQAALLTIVNAGARAFLGGIRVCLDEDIEVVVGWQQGSSMSQAIAHYGGTVVEALEDGHPTICVGDPTGPARGAPVLRATFDGWTAGVMEGCDSELAERDFFAPAGIAAGGIAVAEAFESIRGGNLYAGRRDQGISLWRPELHWLDAEARGPADVTVAPSRLWLVGLGHLGQAYLWAIGMFAFAEPHVLELLLQDDDSVTVANWSTGLLLTRGGPMGRKTRVLAAAVEDRGFGTTLTERRLGQRDGPNDEEPRLALIGVDNPATRRTLSDAGFDLTIDVGLGGGPAHYLGVQMHTFPSQIRSSDVAAWKHERVSPEALLDLPAYQAMIDDAGDRCGTLTVAGRSVAAAFVGATAAAVAIAEATRAIRGDHRYAVVDFSLRDLARIRAIQVHKGHPIPNTGFGRLD